jgi:hypothetical protein
MLICPASPRPRQNNHGPAPFDSASGHHHVGRASTCVQQCRHGPPCSGQRKRNAAQTPADTEQETRQEVAMSETIIRGEHSEQNMAATSLARHAGAHARTYPFVELGPVGSVSHKPLSKAVLLSLPNTPAESQTPSRMNATTVGPVSSHRGPFQKSHGQAPARKEQHCT